MSKILSLHALEILDCRGNPTLEVQIVTRNGVFSASVPSGKSAGKYEACEMRDNEKRYFGKGVRKAVRKVENIISPKIIGMSVTNQEAMDNLLCSLDGTQNKSKLGANTMLAVSMAVCRAGAFEHRLPLYKYIHKILRENNKITIPRAYFNILNGGVHAGNTLAIQECMISPRFATFSRNVRCASEIYHVLKKIIEKKYGKNATNVGDEGGFAPPISSIEDALRLIQKAIIKAGYAGKVDLALDCAASEFYTKKERKYILGKKYSAEELQSYYLTLIKKFNIISIEDPFSEDSFSDFASLLTRAKIQIVGDDLTVTNVERIRQAIAQKSCNSLLLKMNQIGTISQTLDAVRMAYMHSWKVMVSHRSGETTDTFIADLAVGIGCLQIKAGAPARGERVAKYNRLLRIERELTGKKR
jgi:enolase